MPDNAATSLRATSEHVNTYQNGSDMRSTRVTAAVERLKARSGNAKYAMVRTSDGLFYLVEGSGSTDKLNDPMEMNDFVKFVDGFGPQTPRRASKLDIQFEKQLTKKTT